jgi:hypothetical protein
METMNKLVQAQEREIVALREIGNLKEKIGDLKAENAELIERLSVCFPEGDDSAQAEAI